MTQEEKQLLTKDICARLPYVIVHTWYNKPLDIKCTGIDLYTNTINLDIPDDDNAKVYIDNCKPYLRPMSSITTKEEYEYHQYCAIDFNDFAEEHLKLLSQTALCFSKHIDWLNAHYFDYRGLIPMGLALEAPEGMYK